MRAAREGGASWGEGRLGPVWGATKSALACKTLPLRRPERHVCLRRLRCKCQVNARPRLRARGRRFGAWTCAHSLRRTRFSARCVPTRALLHIRALLALLANLDDAHAAFAESACRTDSGERHRSRLSQKALAGTAQYAHQGGCPCAPGAKPFLDLSPGCTRFSQSRHAARSERQAVAP
jgi:hypothetical protein